MKLKKWACIYPVLLWVMGAVMSPGGAFKTKLVNNGYEGVVVAISQDIDESKGPLIIQGIKDMMQESSKSLFHATLKRAYFRSVTILIPKSWSNTQVNRVARLENYEDSEIRVEQMNSLYENQPYTQQPGGCGLPGMHIQLTPEFLTDIKVSRLFGNRGKVLLMEWAKLRWGVFDEVGYQGDELFPPFHIPSNREERRVNSGGEMRPTCCSDKAVEGDAFCRDLIWRYPVIEDDLQMMNENCSFFTYIDQNVTSSLMSLPIFISDDIDDMIVDFCDDATSNHPHDSVAPTKQNHHCGHRSVWEVMRDHPDFATGANLPTSSYVDPVFEVVREEDANYALVLDISGSMSGNLNKLTDALRRWLLDEVADGSYVTIITFSDTATVNHPLTRIENIQSRTSLAASLPAKTTGGTIIGNGLFEATQILRSRSNPVIVLVADGDSSENKNIPQVMSDVLKSGAKVVTVAYTTAADPEFENLARATGGKTFAVTGIDKGAMLEDSLTGALPYQPTPAASDIRVVIYECDGNDCQGGNAFPVDFSVGRNLVFRLYTIAGDDLSKSPQLIGLDGSPKGHISRDSTADSWDITVPLAEVGIWKWKFEGDFSRMRVTAQSRGSGVKPITTKTWTSSGTRSVNCNEENVIIYAEVKQGNDHVVNADVVAAVIPLNSSNPTGKLTLLDNGQGADIQAGDGIYSRFVTNFSVPDRYTFKVKVTGNSKTVVNKGFRAAFGEGPDKPYYCCGSVVPLDLASALPTGNFSRIASAGSIKVVEMPPTDKDSLPPARVRDLRVSFLDVWQPSLTHYNVSLTWTAMGDDLDAGKVSSYHIRMSTDMADLTKTNFGADRTDDVSRVINSTNVDLLEAGTKIHFTTLVEMDLSIGVSYYFAFQAIDDAGLTSPVSNVAVLHIPPHSSVSSTTHTSASSGTDAIALGITPSVPED